MASQSQSVTAVILLTTYHPKKKKNYSVFSMPCDFMVVASKQF